MFPRDLFILFLSSFFCCFWVNAQNDSTLLIPDQLNIDDIIVQASLFNQQKVVSASRTLQSVEDLPLTIYVITKEEIQKYGYVTLVDALKHLPGIRVSQPGNAIDGETFLMRGLKGNSYAKIMINNIPVKPIVAGAMPIGAQLPIQQADRIEVIYGPAAAVYGSDASAGIINIIIDKNDRPTFTRARLNAGVVGGYTDLNLLFGGKLGRNKNIIQFSVYGSTTVFDDQPVIYDDTLFNPLNYARRFPNGSIDSSYVDLFNFKAPNASDFRSSTLPHLSRMFGINLNYRSWKMNFQRMYRRDHSALGLNPLAISYSNPLNYFGENISNFSIGYGRQFKRWAVDFNAFYLGYFVDRRSSNESIYPSLFQGMDIQARVESIHPITQELDQQQYDSLRKELYDFYYKGTRWTYAESQEFAVEQITTYSPTNWLSFSLGLYLRSGRGIPLVGLAQQPIDLKNPNLDQSLPFSTINFIGTEVSSFFQTYINRKRWNMTLGLQAYSFANIYNNELQDALTGINPRLAFLYKVSDNFSLRAFYGRAFRVPAPYYYANTFRINLDTNSRARIAGLPLESETTKTFELGIRWRLFDKINTDLVGFYSSTNNFISYNFNNNINNLSDINSTIGYFNNDNTSITISGIQASIDYKNIIPKIGLDLRLNAQFALSFETNNRTDVVEAQEVPRSSIAAIINSQPLPKLSLSLLNVYQGKVAIDQLSEESFGYYLLDVVFRYDLSDKFQGLLKINNAFNRAYAGLDATRSNDDLYYNPQPLRTWQIGLSYRTN